MMRLIHSLTGTEMLVDPARAEEYLRAGHRPAPTAAERTPAESAGRIPAASGAERPAAAPPAAKPAAAKRRRA